MFRWSGWVVVAALLAAAAYELVLALRHTPSPSEGGALLAVGLLAMLAALGLLLARRRPSGLFAPAAALFVAARFYTGDPYYGPTFRSYSEGGIVPQVWTLALLGAALAAGLATRLWRRTVPVESAAVLALLLLTALFMGTGH